MRKHLFVLASCAAVVASAAPAWAQPAQAAGEDADEATVIAERQQSAQEANDAPDDARSVGLRYRIWGTAADRAAFSEDASVADDPHAALYQQLRADAGVAFGALALRLEIDALAGRLAGDEQPQTPEAFQPAGATPRGGVTEFENVVDPRNVYVQYTTLALLRVGLQTSNFGLGIVANDGEEDDWELFNYRYGGDRALRALAATRPLAMMRARVPRQITLVVGGDVVYRDDNASYIAGDRAYQVISSLFYRDADPKQPSDASFLGAYFAYRTQQDFGGEDLEVVALDLSAKRSWTDDADRFFYELGGEAALITGDTNRTYTTAGRDRTDVLGLGAVAEGLVRFEPLASALKLKLGYASGDANPDDDTLYRFRFDPNYKVGLVLFDHYIPAATREAYARIVDPGRSGEPPRGVHGLISDGAVENALYLNPQLLLGDPEGLLTGVGLLWAYAAEPLMDPFNSFARGGAPTGPRGGPASRDLGVEIDVAARYRRPLVDRLTMELKAEYGILFPGDAFDDVAGNAAAPQNLVRGRIALLW